MAMIDLDRISREGGEAFELALDQASSLVCQEIVRRLPGRRLVCRGLWHGKAVYAKLFIGNDAKRYAERDARGAKALLAHGLPTPELLHEGALADQPGRVLVYALVPESQDADSAMRNADSGQRSRFADALVRTVARHHAAGLMQTDLYPRNFLVSDAGIHTLDGDGIRIHSRPIGVRQGMANLALLVSKFDAGAESRLHEWLRLYAEERGWRRPGIAVTAFANKVQAERRSSARKNVMRKVLRNCSEIQIEQHWNRYLAVVRQAQDADLSAVIADPDGWLDSPASQRMKGGNTCTVGLVQSGARKIVVKRYNIKNFGHGLGRAWRRTRASVSWSNAHLLRSFDIVTPAPLALIECRWGPLRRQAYFLTEFVAGPDIAEVLADAVLPEAEQAEIVARVALLLRKLRILNIEHGDMKASNMKWVDGRPLLLDLDAMKLHRCEWWFMRRHARDLRRFLKNWHNAPDILRSMESALITAYGDDPVLKMAGIVRHDTSEYK